MKKRNHLTSKIDKMDIVKASEIEHQMGDLMQRIRETNFGWYERSFLYGQLRELLGLIEDKYDHDPYSDDRLLDGILYILRGTLPNRFDEFQAHTHNNAISVKWHPVHHQDSPIQIEVSIQPKQVTINYTSSKNTMGATIKRGGGTTIPEVEQTIRRMINQLEAGHKNSK